jgi:hypothetical protein
MQQCHNGPRHNLPATFEEGEENQQHQGTELKRVITSGKQNIAQQDLQGDPRAGDHEASSQDFQWVVKNE